MNTGTELAPARTGGAKAAASSKAAAKGPKTAKAPKIEIAPTRSSKRAAGTAKAGTAKATTVKRTKATPTRKAVLARSAGGPGAAPRPTTTRRRR
jgi:hypothetical protein